MAKPPGCPICRKPVVEKFRPFCSLRCSEVDLGRWFGEAYSVPAETVTDDEPEDMPE